MNQIEKLYSEKQDIESFARGYLNYLTDIFGKMDVSQIGKFVKSIESARERGSRIFFIGNGGSAATASHFANDIGIGTRAWNKPFKAVALTDNQAVLTAIGNDYGYDDLFSLQLRVQMSKGDVVVAISASGNSPNVIKAIEYANEHGAETIGLTGFDGGKLSKVCHINVHVPSSKGEYGPVEDLHMILDHLIGAYLIQSVKQNSL